MFLGGGVWGGGGIWCNTGRSGRMIPAIFQEHLNLRTSCSKNVPVHDSCCNVSFSTTCEMFPVLLVLFMTIILAIYRWLPLSSIKKAIKIVSTTTSHVVAQPIRERVSHTHIHTTTTTTTTEIEQKKGERVIWCCFACGGGGIVYVCFILELYKLASYPGVPIWRRGEKERLVHIVVRMRLISEKSRK